MRTAIAVVEAWPETRDEVVRRFLKVLRDRVADDLREFANLRIEAGYGRKGERDGIWIFGTTWRTDTGALPTIWLSHDGGANNWFVGVLHEAGNGDTDTGERLKESLHRAMPGARSRSWLWYRYLEGHKDWAPLLSRLHEESRNGGDLVDDLDRELVTMAKVAVPIIDGVLSNR